MANRIRVRCFLAFAIAAVALPGSVVHTAVDLPRRSVERPGASTLAQSAGAAYLRLPLRFEPAHQSSANDAFVARGSGYSVSLSSAGASLLLEQQPGGGHRTVTMSLAGGNREARATLRRALPGFSNYLIGSGRQSWVTGVRGYGEIEYRGVYRGVDVVYYGNQRKLEFDFIVAPGGSADAIALAFDGAKSVSVNSTGEVVIATDGGDLVQHRPTIYQDDRGVRRAIRGSYIVRRDGKIGFRIGKYDRRLPLVIDPVLSYATYLGGGNTERGYALAVDPAGHIFVAGVTVSPDFPVAHAAQPQKKGHVDAFVVKLTPAGDAMAYSTYFGGGGYDEARDVAVDEGGNAYVTGYTDSWDFPVGRTLGTPERRKQAFVIKLDSTGALAYSTLIGGSGYEEVKGIAVDAAGRAHVAGMTSSADFPLVDPWQRLLGGYAASRTHDRGGAWTALNTGLQVSGVSAFGFDPAEPTAVYAGAIGEGLFKSVDDGATWTRVDLPAQRFNAIAAQEGDTPALFAAGDFGLYRSHDRGATWTVVSPYGGAGVTTIAITRGSPSTIYVGLAWSPGVLKSVDGGDTWIETGFADPVQQLAASGSTVYALARPPTGYGGVFKSNNGGPWEPAGGTGHDVPVGFRTTLAVDPADPQVAYVGTEYGLFKTTSGGGAWTPVFDFSLYVGIVVIAPSDPSTLFVGTSSGHLFIRDDGQTWSVSGLDSDLQLAVIAFDPLDSAHLFAGFYRAQDGFVATLSADGSRLDYATYIGGTRAESAESIAVDPAGNRYVTGDTFSKDFPTVHPIQSLFGGTWDSFVVKLSPSGQAVYSTYLGGGHTDYNARIAADASGRAYVTGLTLSTNFPVVNAAQPAHGGGFSDVFVTVLDESGGAFLYSTFLGGSAMENDPSQALGPAIAVTPAGEASITGTTQSIDFPVTADAWHRTHAGGVSDVFVTRYDAGGTLQYSTYLGGPAADYARRIALDSSGAVVIAGYTDSTNWATPTAVQPSYAGSDDAFVAKLLPGPTPADTIAPTTTIALAGTSGIPGWFKSPVTVSLSSVENDGGRGLAYAEYSLNGSPFKRYTAPFTVSESGTTRIAARGTDWAGNVESPAAAAAVAIDTKGPILSFQVTGTFGLAAWLKSPATVTVFAVDVPGTGVESVEYRIGDAAFQPYTGSFAVAAEGVTQVTARATDRNGNVSTSTRGVSIDTSAPRTSLTVSGSPGLMGWYTSPVTVSLSGTDAVPGSGVAAVEYRIDDGVFLPYVSPFVVSRGGATRITARARDRAGNLESPLPSAQVMIDSSAPVVAIASPESRDYLHSESVALSFSAADSMSGLQSMSAALDSGAVENSQTIPLQTHSLGTHTLEVFATDVAGNIGRRSVSFRIVATIDSLIASVNNYAEQGKIDAANLRSLLAKLNDAKAALDRGNSSSASAKLGDFITQCRTQSGRGISADAAVILTADADYVMGTL